MDTTAKFVDIINDIYFIFLTFHLGQNFGLFLSVEHGINLVWPNCLIVRLITPTKYGSVL